MFYHLYVLYTNELLYGQRGGESGNEDFRTSFAIRMLTAHNINNMTTSIVNI